MPQLIDLENMTTTQAIQLQTVAAAINHWTVAERARQRAGEWKRDLLSIIDSGRAIAADGKDYALQRAARYVLDAAKSVNDRIEAVSDVQWRAASAAFAYLDNHIDNESAALGFDFLYTAANRLATVRPDGSDLAATLDLVSVLISRPEVMG